LRGGASTIKSLIVWTKREREQKVTVGPVANMFDFSYVNIFFCYDFFSLLLFVFCFSCIGKFGGWNYITLFGAYPDKKIKSPLRDFRVFPFSYCLPSHS